MARNEFEHTIESDTFGSIELAIHKILFAKNIFDREDFQHVTCRGYHFLIYPFLWLRQKVWERTELMRTLYHKKLSTTLWLIIRDEKYEGLAFEYSFEVSAKESINIGIDEMFKYLDDIEVSSDAGGNDPNEDPDEDDSEPRYRFGMHVVIRLPHNFDMKEFDDDPVLRNHRIYFKNKGYANVVHQENLKEILEKQETNPLFMMKEYMPAAQRVFPSNEVDVTLSEDSECAWAEGMEKAKRKATPADIKRKFHENSSSGPFVDCDFATYKRSFHLNGVDPDKIECSSSDECEDMNSNELQGILSKGELKCCSSEEKLEDDSLENLRVGRRGMLKNKGRKRSNAFTKSIKEKELSRLGNEVDQSLSVGKKEKAKKKLEEMQKSLKGQSLSVGKKEKAKMKLEEMQKSLKSIQMCLAFNGKKENELVQNQVKELQNDNAEIEMKCRRYPLRLRRPRKL